MARDGYRIFDSDTHVGPDAAILEPYLSRGLRTPSSSVLSAKRWLSPATIASASPAPSKRCRRASAKCSSSASSKAAPTKKSPPSPPFRLVP